MADFETETVQLWNDDCLEILQELKNNSIDSIVTDPPYGLGFMGKKWDYQVPSVDIWRACLRVLKPGAHLLAFAGTRTQHRMAVAIEDAGFEIRDMIAWVYGCLSEDSEVLTEDGWMRYNIATQKQILAYDIQNDVYQWERPSRWNEYRVESDTAYRIQSDHTDQIVSRGHRCIVERGGVLTFVPADELSSVERMPYLQGDFSALPEGCGELLLETVLRESEGLAEEALSERQGQEASWQGACWRQKPGMEGRGDLLQAQGEVRGSVDQVRSMPRSYDANGAQGRVCDGAPACSCAGNQQAADAGGVCASHQSRCDGQPAGESDAICQQCGSQAVRARASYRTTLATVTPIEYSGLIWCPTVSTGAFVARRNGKVFITGNSGFPKSLDVSKAIDKMGGEPLFSDFANWLRTERTKRGLSQKKVAEAGGFYANVNRGGLVANWELGYCVPSTAQFNKLCDILCVPMNRRVEVEREVIGTRRVNPGVAFSSVGPAKLDITAPATDAARQWQGWGTALKPALEPITLARKPLEGTVAQNVLQYGTGALNVDGCRVSIEERDSIYEKNPHTQNTGRWPANLIHDGSDEVMDLFPQTGSGNNKGAYSYTGKEYNNKGTSMFNGDKPQSPSNYNDTGSAARFFYCAKATKSERGKSNNHPTVKPIALMRYLCKLVTPPRGIVLDPFMGSGTTGKAALAERFKFIGIEVDSGYFEIAKERIQIPSNHFIY